MDEKYAVCDSENRIQKKFKHLSDAKSFVIEKSIMETALYELGFDYFYNSCSEETRLKYFYDFCFDDDKFKKYRKFFILDLNK